MTQAAAWPPDEQGRLSCLSSLQVLDSEPEPIFEQITRLAAELCAVPIALVSLVDSERQWFKSNMGLAGVGETHRDLAFCAHAILSDALMEVADATLDPRFAENLLVTGGPKIRFYAGAPLTMPQGERIGTLCVIDRLPRQLTPLQRTALVGLAALVSATLIERRRRLALSEDLAATEAGFRAIVEGQTELISLADEDGGLSYVNPAYAQFFGCSPADMIGRSLFDFVAESDRAAVAAQLHKVVAEGEVASGVNRMVAADGQERWVAWSNRCIPGPAGRSGVIHSVGRDITEQRRAELALADNEARSRMMYQATPAMLHSIDLQGNLLDVSDAWLQRMGQRRDEVIGRPSVAFLTPASAAHACSTVLPEFFRSGRCDDVAYQMVRKDGSTIDVLLSAVLERDPLGQPLRSLAVVQDVTERNRATASLNETTHMLQLVLDGLPARISYWGVDGCNRFANKAFLEWFGVEQQAIVRQHAREVLGPEVYARAEQSFVDGLGGQPRQVEVVSPGREGKERTTDMRYIPDLNAGQVHGLFVLALDITAQRQAERDLADRERRFELLVDGVRDYAIYMLDPDGCVATWNSGAERNQGFRAEQVLGQPDAMFYTAQDVALGRPRQALAVAARDGRFEAEGWRVRGDGTRFWAGVHVSALRDDRHRLVGYAEIARDLTDQRRQQATTEQALLEKETLLKEVYHRVKNNLQVVQSLLNLQRRALPEGLAQDAMHDSVQRVRAMALVHEKLYQSGNLAAISLPVYTRELVEQIAEAHGIDRSTMKILVDVAAIETGLDSAVPYGLLLTELVTNSFKHAFAPGGGGTLAVTLVRQQEGDLLTVCDNGVGYADDLESSIRSASMGLKLADSLARQLGGELQTQSKGGAKASALLTRL